MATMTKRAKVVPVRKVWMSQKEAMAYLGVSRGWLEDKRRRGLLSYSMIDKTAVYIKSELDRIVLSHVRTGGQHFNTERTRTYVYD